MKPVASPEILAAAIARIRRKDRIPPTIAKRLDECERARQAALNARRVALPKQNEWPPRAEALALVGQHHARFIGPSFEWPDSHPPWRNFAVAGHSNNTSESTHAYN